MRVQHASFIVHGIGKYNSSRHNAIGGYTSPVDGKYYDEPVRVTFGAGITEARTAIKVFEEESVLYVDEDRNAYLVFADGGIQSVGKFQRFKSNLLPHIEAIKRGWTHFDGHTYVCV